MDCEHCIASFNWKQQEFAKPKNGNYRFKQLQKDVLGLNIHACMSFRI